MAMPNRLEANWNAIKPRILKRWDRVASPDLDSIEFRFDALIELIRQRYKPGRSSITVEAKIYDWLLKELKEVEKESA